MQTASAILILIALAIFGAFAAGALTEIVVRAFEVGQSLAR